MSDVLERGSIGEPRRVWTFFLVASLVHFLDVSILYLVDHPVTWSKVWSIKDLSFRAILSKLSQHTVGVALSEANIMGWQCAGWIPLTLRVAVSAD